MQLLLKLRCVWNYLEEVVRAQFGEVPIDLADALAPMALDSVKKGQADEALAANRHAFERRAVLQHSHERCHARQWEIDFLDRLVQHEELLPERSGELLAALEQERNFVLRKSRDEQIGLGGGSCFRAIGSEPNYRSCAASHVSFLRAWRQKGQTHDRPLLSGGTSCIHATIE